MPPAVSEGITLVEAKCEIAVGLWREKRYAEANIVLDEAEGCEATPDEKLKLAMVRGMVYRGQRRFADAKEVLLKASPLAELTGDSLLRGKYHNGLAITLRNLRDWDQAFQEYTAASVFHELAGALKARAEIENNIGNLLVDMGEPEKAHDHLDTALASCSDFLFVAQVDDTRARALLAEDLKGESDEAQLERALDFALRSRDALKGTNERRLYAEVIVTVRRICERMERLHERERIAAVIGDHSIKEAAALVGMSHQTLRWKLENQYTDLLSYAPQKKKPRGPASKK